MRRHRRFRGLSRPKPQPLILTEWEIFFTYSSFLAEPLPALALAARRLVHRGLAVTAVTSEGLAVWRAGETLYEGPCETRLRGDKPVGALTIPRQRSPFIRRAHIEAASRRYSEFKLFGSETPIPPGYVRATIAPCVLADQEDPDRARLLHPTITMYETGDVVVSLRVVHDATPIGLDAFITEHLRLRQRQFDHIVIPPRLAQIDAFLAYEHFGRFSWRQQRRRARDLATFNRQLREVTFQVAAADTQFEHATMSAQGAADPQPGTVYLARTLMSAAGYEVARDADGWGRGRLRRRTSPDYGLYWFGRPHIHLVRFKGQAETAAANEARFGDAFGQILVGTAGAPPGLGRSHLPPNLRPWDDLAAYVDEGATLWAWARRGLEREEAAAGWQDNPGHFVDEHEVQGEVLNLGHIIHRRLYRLMQRGGGAAAVLQAQRDVLELEGALRETGHFGEIRTLLETGWAKMGVPALQQSIGRLLTIERDAAQIRYAERQGRQQTVLTVLFGMLAVPVLTDTVLKPVWRYWMLPRTANDDAHSLMLTGVAVAAVILVLLAARRLVWRRRFRDGA